MSWKINATEAEVGTSLAAGPSTSNRRQDGREEVSMSEATEVAAADP